MEEEEGSGGGGKEDGVKREEEGVRISSCSPAHAQATLAEGVEILD